MNHPSYEDIIDIFQKLDVSDKHILQFEFDCIE